MAFNKFGTPVAMSVTAKCRCSVCAAETMCGLVGSRYICANCQQDRWQSAGEAEDKSEEDTNVAT